MKKRVLCGLMLLGRLTGFGQSPKVVLVIADGIPADVIERLQPPHLMEIAAHGFYKRAYVGGMVGTYSETPTISAPGYTDMLTGTWAYKHHVLDNENQSPNYHYPTIFRVLKDARPEAKTAIFSTWQDNRTVLLGAGLPATNHLPVDYVYDGYEKDSLHFPHDPDGWYLHLIDDFVVAKADSVIRAAGPDLSWIYLEHTDDVGHARGTGASFDSAIMILDSQVARLSAATDDRSKKTGENWLLLITTDHGRDSIDGKEHGGQTTRERTTWMVCNQGETNSYFAAGDPAIVDILPTALQFLAVHPDTATAREFDGVSLRGPVSVSHPRLTTRGDDLVVTWKNESDRSPVKIYISYTNHFAIGGGDEYQLLGSVPAGQARFQAIVAGLKDRPFYKIVVEGKSNSVNVLKIGVRSSRESNGEISG